MNYLLDIFVAVDWNSFVEAETLLLVPTVFCLLIWLKSPLVKSFGRLLATMATLSLFGWAIGVVSVFAGPPPDNGFAYVSVLSFGWIYGWVLGVPVLLLSLLLRALDGLVRWIRKKAGRESCGRKPVVCMVVLAVAALVLYPLCLSVRPSEMWNEWGGRQYRARVKQGIVHVQIREAGKIADVRSDASGWHRFKVEPLSADELLLKSSDTGSRIIRKVDGEWVAEAGERYEGEGK